MARNYIREYHGIEIKNCPFCGRQAKLYGRSKTMIAGKLRHTCYVACKVCDARGKRVLEDGEFEPVEAREQAVLAWNKRV